MLIIKNLTNKYLLGNLLKMQYNQLRMIGGIVILRVIEACRNEFKIKLPDDLEETVISFLNSKEGGDLV